MNKIKTGFLATIIVLFLWYGLGVSVALAARGSLTTSEERDLGEKFITYVKKRFDLVEDPSIVNYVNGVGQRILDHCASPPFDFQFYVVEEDVYNAFAGPGGHIFIYSGLLVAMESEDELAGILAHEIGHVVGRHISEQIEQSKKIGLATLAGVVAGVFLGGSAATTSAITTGSIAAGQSLSLKYSREHEVEADQLGIRYLTDAGYDGEALIKVLEKIRQKQWFGSKEVPSYLSTHPAVEARLMYLDTWIQVHKESTPENAKAGLSEFQKTRTKLIALCVDSPTAHHMFDAVLRKDPNNALGYYGKGLVLYEEGKKDAAMEALKQALALRPLDSDILRSLGEVYFAMGDYTKAINTLKNALAFDFEDVQGRFLLGRAYMETEKLEAARRTLAEVIQDAPDYLQARYHLGETFGRLGDLPEAHYHLGLYYKEKGPRETAVFHLRRAMKLFSENEARQEEIRRLLKGLSEGENKKVQRQLRSISGQGASRRTPVIKNSQSRFPAISPTGF